MARRAGKGFFVVAVLLLISTLLPVSLSSSRKKPPPPAARREDIPFIKCQVCVKIAHQLYHQVKKRESQKKVSEFQIIEIAENICNLKKEEADWILRIDVVEKRDALELVEQDAEGHCNMECKTIERACQEKIIRHRAKKFYKDSPMVLPVTFFSWKVMDYSDTDVAEFLYKAKPSIDSLVNYLCNDLSKACSSKPPPVPKNRIPGEPFLLKSSKEAEMEKIMRSMEGMPGAPGMKMYSKEDLMNMNNFGDEEVDEEEDDDDNFPSKLGKTLREKESARADLKQRILQGIKVTWIAVKEHINKVSHQIQKWWGGKKSGSQHKKSGKVEL